MTFEYSRNHMSLSNVYSQVENSVARLVAFDQASGQAVSYGSGSVVLNNNLVLTCSHCIPPGSNVQAPFFANGINLSPTGTVIFNDPALDIALIEFPVAIGQAVTFGDSAQVKIGDPVFTVGFPMLVGEKNLSSGYIGSVAGNWFRLDASVNGGNSGGPLFDVSGHQIGVVNAKHGAISTYLRDTMNAPENAQIIVGGVNPIQAIKHLIAEMEANLNLGIGYAIPVAILRGRHGVFDQAIP